MSEASDCTEWDSKFGEFRIGEDDQIYSSDVDDTLQFPPKNELIYTSCYCEENVWKLCEYVKNHRIELLDYCFAVFISNDCRTIPLWEQKAGVGENFVVFWDYHVIFLFYDHTKRSCIYDLDSRLPFPTEFRMYMTRAIKSNKAVTPAYRRKLRVIPAEMYLETFASDRSHMKSSNGQWISAPPSYSPISTPEYKNNIQDYISMDGSIGFGKVMSVNDFFQQYSPPKPKIKYHKRLKSKHRGDLSESYEDDEGNE